MNKCKGKKERKVERIGLKRRNRQDKQLQNVDFFGSWFQQTKYIEQKT